MGKPPALPEIAGFKLLTSPAAMDFLVKTDNEAPRSKLRGIKVELRRSPYPPSLCRASARFTLPFYRGVAESEDRSSLLQAAGYSGEGE